MTQKVVLTDHPWPELHIEQSIFAAAGIELVAGPIEAPTASVIESMVAKHRPDAILCCWAPVTKAAIDSAGELKIVSRMGVGLDNIAVAAATARGAWVTNVPDYCVEEVSDHAIAMMTAHWRGVVHFDREAKLGHWNPASANLKRIRDRVIGIIGYGRIGQATARKLVLGYRAKVMVHSPTLLDKYRDGVEIEEGIVASSIASIQARADAVVLHMPLSTENRQFVNAAFLRALKKRPLLINVSRGGLIDNAALIDALNAGQLAGAALDVIDGEPTPPASIMGRRDVIVTPHIAFSSDASLAELRRRCSEEVVRVLRGEPPLHPCNVPHR
jgi:D-3-phosphoglycerate dehydrogenase